MLLVGQVERYENKGGLDLKTNLVIEKYQNYAMSAHDHLPLTLNRNN